MQATGGSGDYAWITNDTGIAGVGLNGGGSSQAVVSTKNTIGTSLITAYDVKNNLHSDTAQVGRQCLMTVIQIQC